MHKGARTFTAAFLGLQLTIELFINNKNSLLILVHIYFNCYRFLHAIFDLVLQRQVPKIIKGNSKKF